MNDFDAILRYPLFAALDAAAITAWVAAGRPRRVDLGETLLSDGTPGHSVYLVRSGRVRVSKAARSGSEVVLGDFRPGELFGEYALTPPGNNTATCRAASAGDVLELPLEPLRRQLHEQPEVRAQLKRWLRLHAILGQFRGRNFLGFMSATSLLPFLDRFESMRFPAATTIQVNGLSDDRWFVILKGAARQATAGDAGPGRRLAAGDNFGAKCLLPAGGTADDDLPGVETLEPVECASISREEFYRSLRNNAETPMVKASANSKVSLQTIRTLPAPPPRSRG